MEVLGIETFASMLHNPPKVGDSIGVLLPLNTEVKRGDIIVASNPLVNLKSHGEAETCKVSDKGVRFLN